STKGTFRYNASPHLTGITVTPFFPVTGQPVTLTVHATDPDANDTLTITFDWGDSNGFVPSNQFTFDTAGSYLVSIKITDGVNTINQQTTLSVLKSDVLTVTKLSGAVKVTSQNADSFSLSATMPTGLAGLDPAVVLAGQQITLNVGAVQFPFTLDGKGKAKA